MVGRVGGWGGIKIKANSAQLELEPGLCLAMRRKWRFCRRFLLDFVSFLSILFFVLSEEFQKRLFSLMRNERKKSLIAYFLL